MVGWQVYTSVEGFLAAKSTLESLGFKVNQVSSLLAGRPEADADCQSVHAPPLTLLQQPGMCLEFKP